MPSISQSPVLMSTPQAPVAPVKSQTEKPVPEKSLGDTLVRSGAGLLVGGQTGMVVGGLGFGAITAMKMGSHVPFFHKLLGTVGAGGMGAISGAVAGAAGGIAASNFANTKTQAVGVGAGTGAVVGAVAAAALNIAMKKFEPGAIAAAAMTGAALGAAGGFAGQMVTGK